MMSLYPFEGFDNAELLVCLALPWWVVISPDQKVQESTWIVKNHGWPHFFFQRTQNASVLECALQPNTLEHREH